ncbi:unnamed protein product [Adineta steineri]|uniref:Uncharacterized protein n=1 Tax=Adineta steineri TaxID=433720 RepID=A0A814BTL6_9BILA|nr:unnamed protein product [Adineta steineri]CAF0933850.1 unnamed protein product [Adineta steineri]CAF0941977.1 unnamed protein product [Adineta steineri]CAF3518871.1 unnamed protein product [Adineta steineri]CAF3575196.1 unnamed protein product [Adineta steineri]
MTLPSETRYDFVPTASILAFIFIGIIFLIGLIGRCLALNQSTIRSAQSLDLMIYRIPPRANSSMQKIRPSIDVQSDLTSIPITPTPIQRGPKNL